MFLFLSKLLPLFIYPLGLTCLLLVVALVTLWRYPRVAASLIATALGLILISGNTGIANQLVRSLEFQNLPPDELPQADAIVVLGGATRSPLPPRPWVEVNEAGDRPLHGARLYLAGKAPRVILSGGRIEWRGAGSPESADMAEIVRAMGVPATAILQDPRSLNTYENAVNVKRILDQQGIHRVLLVTSAMHMPRSLRIFAKQGIEAIAAPTDFLTTLETAPEAIGWRSQVLNSLPDTDAIDRFTRALKEYIGTGIYRLRGWL